MQPLNDNEQHFSLVLASSVHDMKNSLNMLLYSLEAEIRANPARDEAQAQRFAVLQYEASRINSDLIQLLSIYRMQNQRLPFNLEEHFVADVIEEQIARNDMLFITRDLAIDLDCDPELQWYFDAELVGSVIHNVLINAARYSQRKLLVSVAEIDDGLAISVADDGSGFPSAMLNAPLDLLHNPPDPTAGTHLGLYFAHRVAQLHQQKGRCGSISLSNNSMLGGGLFRLWLP